MVAQDSNTGPLSGQSDALPPEPLRSTSKYKPIH